MDQQELNRLVREVDEQHHATMATMVEQLADGLSDARASDQAADRRGFLRRAAMAITAGSAAVVVGSRQAAAQTNSTTSNPTASVGSVATNSSAPTSIATASSAAATTTTAPQKSPNNADLKLLAFAQSLELSAVDAYAVALGGKLLTGPAIVVATTFMSHHRQHAQALGGLAAKAAPNTANATISKKFGARLAGAATEADLLKAAFDIETAAASSYVALLGALVGTDAAATVASIQPVEARHAAVIGQYLGLPVATYLPNFEDPTTGALNPADYPIS